MVQPAGLFVSLVAQARAVRQFSGAASRAVRQFGGAGSWLQPAAKGFKPLLQNVCVLAFVRLIRFVCLFQPFRSEIAVLLAWV